ncbi:MAG: 30S ribosome-binding factor RbfA [Spirochaetota bacterium]|jgi:ribosome-binding factor A|nr:30S ribosome-binding factor RbfA [Spirochaetota bacterium]
MGVSYRTERAAERILQELSRLVREEMRDPRLQDSVLTLHEVRLSRDLGYADVFVSALDSGKEKEILAALHKGRSFLRSRLAEALDFRKVPELRFHLDSSIEEGYRIERIIQEANKTG